MTSPTVAEELPEHPAVVLARTGPEALPLCVRMKTVPYGLRAALPLTALLALIFVPFGTWLTVSTGSLEPLLSFAAIPLVLGAGFAVFMVLRARGPALAADEHGVWLRPGHNWALAAWQPWHGIAEVSVRRFFGAPNLCVRPRDPAYERWFSMKPTGGRDVKIGLRVVKVWRERRLQTNLFVPLPHADHTPQQVIAKLQELAAGRCEVG